MGPEQQVNSELGRGLKAAVALGGVVVLVTLGLALALAAACDTENVAPPVQTPTLRSTEVITVESGGRLELETREARPGQTVQASGTDWNGTGPVKFHLLTEEQFRDIDLKTEPVRLGEQTTADDGSLSLEFRLAERYEAPDGQALVIVPGQKLYVMATQRTDGGGSHSSGGGPLTVSSTESE